MNSDQLLQLYSGKIEYIEIGRIHIVAASIIGAHAVDVRLSRETLQHITKTHPDMVPYDILLLPDAVQAGLIIQEEHRPNHLSICYQHPKIEKKRYIAGLKYAAGTHELWVSTFHRAKPRQTISMLARGQVIKRHT